MNRKFVVIIMLMIFLLASCKDQEISKYDFSEYDDSGKIVFEIFQLTDEYDLTSTEVENIIMANIRSIPEQKNRDELFYRLFEYKEKEALNYYWRSDFDEHKSLFETTRIGSKSDLKVFDESLEIFSGYIEELLDKHYVLAIEQYNIRIINDYSYYLETYSEYFSNDLKEFVEIMTLFHSYRLDIYPAIPNYRSMDGYHTSEYDDILDLIKSIEKYQEKITSDFVANKIYDCYLISLYVFYYESAELDPIYVKQELVSKQLSDSLIDDFDEFSVMLHENDNLVTVEVSDFINKSVNKFIRGIKR